MTKQIIIDLAKSFGLNTAYQGTTKTLYVKGDRYGEFFYDVTEKYVLTSLDFVIVHETGELPTFNLNVDTIEALGNPPLPVEAYDSDVNRIGLWQINEVEESKEISQYTKENIEARRKLLDEYLITNPVDRTQKGCYATAAATFEVTVDYVRDRYRKLRAKGLVEKESVVA